MAPQQSQSRAASLFAFDGRLARFLRVVFQYFSVSVSFIATLAPTLAFDALVGWQSTHLAIWLGAISLVPIAWGVRALVVTMAGVLDDGDFPAVRTYWREFARSARSMWWCGPGVALFVALLAYDVALSASSDVILLLAAVAVAVLVVLIVGLASIREPNPGPLRVLVVTVGAIARRPHLALCWLLIVAACAAVTALPVIGPSLAFVSPGLGAATVVICNRVLRFDRGRSDNEEGSVEPGR